MWFKRDQAGKGTRNEGEDRDLLAEGAHDWAQFKRDQAKESDRIAKKSAKYDVGGMAQKGPSWIVS